MAIDKDDLDKLSPQDRIKKLKKLEKQVEEDKKKQLSEIGSLIKKSMQELKNVQLASEIMPRQRDIEISNLFERNNSNEMQLERTAREKKSSPDSNYHAVAQMYKDYSRLKQMYGSISTGNSLTQDQINAINTINERLGVAEKYISDSERISSVLDSTKSLMYSLRKRTGL